MFRVAVRMPGGTHDDARRCHAPRRRRRRGRAAQAGIRVEFGTSPERYRHWRLAVDGPVATLTLAVDPGGGLDPGTQLFPGHSTDGAPPVPVPA